MGSKRGACFLRPFLLISFCLVPFPARAGRGAPLPARARVNALFVRIQDIFVRERRGDLASDEIEALDAKARKILDKTVTLGLPAVEPLFDIAREEKSFKSRLWALSAMGLIGGPQAFRNLQAVLNDSGFPDLLRAQAAFLIGAFKGDAVEKRTALCRELEIRVLAKPIFVECLRQVSAMGCPKVAALVMIARSFGAKPQKKNASLVSYALKALNASPAEEAVPALLDLAAFYKRETSARLEAVEGLWGFRVELPRYKDAAVPALSHLLLEESRRPQEAVLILNLLDPIKDKTLIPLLGRYKRHPNQAVAALAAREWRDLEELRKMIRKRRAEKTRTGKVR